MSTSDSGSHPNCPHGGSVYDYFALLGISELADDTEIEDAINRKRAETTDPDITLLLDNARDALLVSRSRRLEYLSRLEEHRQSQACGLHPGRTQDATTVPVKQYVSKAIGIDQHALVRDPSWAVVTAGFYHGQKAPQALLAGDYPHRRKAPLARIPWFTEVVDEKQLKVLCQASTPLRVLGPGTHRRFTWPTKTNKTLYTLAFSEEISIGARLGVRDRQYIDVEARYTASIRQQHSPPSAEPKTKSEHYPLGFNPKDIARAFVAGGLYGPYEELTDETHELLRYHWFPLSRLSLHLTQLIDTYTDRVDTTLREVASLYGLVINNLSLHFECIDVPPQKTAP
ncbi:MAG: hypothetical protein D8M59_07530 [Planctomycetes bacterium]|nr:hypothetical protein [Planctomycetota bacterium]NOG53178.1 hypothetical protein [Planctomycetota bacterium]